MTDSSENYIKGLEIVGSTEQVSTTGKNLFDKNQLKKGFGFSDDAMEIVSDDGYISDYIKIDISTTYYISGNHKGLSTRMIFFDSDKQPIGRSESSSYESKTLSSSDVGVVYEGKDKNDVCYVLFWFYSISSVSIDEILNKNIQLEKGTTVTPYEPYTGGKPSPSPEYPQEIKNVGKYNEETGKYEVQVKFTGTNLFPFSNEFSNYKPQKPDTEIRYTDSSITITAKQAYVNVFSPSFKLKPNTTYTLSGIFSTTGKYTDVRLRLFKNLKVVDYLRQFVQIRSVNGETYLKAEFTTDNMLDTTEVVVVLDAAFNATTLPVTSMFSDLQIEYGDTATSYQPYKSQTLTLTSDRPITKWDKLVEQDGQIGWLYGSDSITFDGSDDEKWVEGAYSSKNIIVENMLSGTRVGGFCIELSTEITNNEVINGDTVIRFGNGNKNISIFNAKNILKNEQTWIQFLQENNLHVVYKTEQPEFVPLPQSEQDAIRSLKTYYPTTVITADGGEVSPDISVSYVADTKNYIDGKFAQMNASLVNTQKALL